MNKSNKASEQLFLHKNNNSIIQSNKIKNRMIYAYTTTKKYIFTLKPKKNSISPQEYIKNIDIY